MSRPSPVCILEDHTTTQSDFSVFDYTPGLNPVLRDFPTVVWEIACTQSSRPLAEAAARWIAASLCRVQLVIAIDIILGTRRTSISGRSSCRAKDERHGLRRRFSERAHFGCPSSDEIFLHSKRRQMDNYVGHENRNDISCSLESKDWQSPSAL